MLQVHLVRGGNRIEVFQFCPTVYSVNMLHIVNEGVDRIMCV